MSAAVSLDLSHIQNASSTPSYQSPTSNEMNVDDAQAFSQMLTDESLETGSLGDEVMKQFMHISQNLQQYKNDANNSIKQATLSPDPKNILQMMHKVNDYSEQLTIGARLVGKVSSAADQLTKLQ